MSNALTVKKHTALITGASLGIGLELAKLFAAQKFDLVLVARSENKLEVLADELKRAHGIQVHVIAADLIDSKACEKLEAEVNKRGLQIDYLVNNAGFGGWGHFVDTPLKDDLGMIQLNISALTELCKRFAGPMKKRGFGRIMNVASIAGYQPGPLMAVYYATKAYVISFSYALHNELKGTGVTVTTLSPGPTLTGFQQAAGVGDIMLFESGVMTAEAAARAGFKGMMKGSGTVIPSVRNRIFAMVGKVSPGPLAAIVARMLQEKRAR